MENASGKNCHLLTTVYRMIWTKRHEPYMDSMMMKAGVKCISKKVQFLIVFFKDTCVNESFILPLHCKNSRTCDNICSIINVIL